MIVLLAELPRGEFDIANKNTARSAVFISQYCINGLSFFKFMSEGKA